MVETVSNFWDGYFAKIHATYGIGNGFRSCHDCGATVYEDNLSDHYHWHAQQYDDE